MAITAKWWIRPYPETIRSWFPRKTPRTAIYENFEFEYVWRQLLFFSVAFIVMGQAFSLFAGSFVWPWEFFINTPLYSIQSFAELFTKEHRLVLGEVVFQNLITTYYITSLVLTCYAVFLFERFVVGIKKRGKNFSYERLLSAFVIFTLAFAIDSLVALVMKNAGVSLIKAVYSKPIVPAAVNFTIGMGGNFLLYFILTDIMSELIVATVSIFALSIIENAIGIPGQLLQFYLLTIVSLSIKDTIEKAGLSQRLANFIAKWAYTPKFMLRVTFVFFWLLLWCLIMFVNRSRKLDNYFRKFFMS